MNDTNILHIFLQIALLLSRNAKDANKTKISTGWQHFLPIPLPSSGHWNDGMIVWKLHTLVQKLVLLIFTWTSFFFCFLLFQSGEYSVYRVIKIILPVLWLWTSPAGPPSKSHGDHGNFDGCQYPYQVLNQSNEYPSALHHRHRVECLEIQHL